MIIFRKFWPALVLSSLMGCSDSSDHHPITEPAPPEPQFLAIADATIDQAPDIGAPLDLGSFDLALVGYEETEYFISGTASAFTNLNELGSDGQWEVEAAEQAPYATRLLVRRPTSGADFSGTVIVEWMNVSAGFDTTPEWNNAHVEIVRSGHAWVGVTAQFVGIYGREGGIAPFHLKAYNAERYAALEHPGDSFSYDIYSQVAQAIRAPSGLNMLEGLDIELLLGFGESQSASRMATYVNAIQLLYNPYDGYMIHSRGDRSSSLAQEPQVGISTPEKVSIRGDLNVPVLFFQTETDVLREGATVGRQDASDVFRLWEVAGTAHADYYTSVSGSFDTGIDPAYAAVIEETSVLGFIECEFPMNSGPMHYVFNAATAALDSWARGGDAPPQGPLLQISDDFSAYAFDDLGNVLGGIRTPYVDAPVAILSGKGQSGESFCFLFGTTELFSAELMASLYTNEAGYVAAVAEAAESAVAAGFLLQVDADQIITWAPSQWQQQTAQ